MYLKLTEKGKSDEHLPSIVSIHLTALRAGFYGDGDLIVLRLTHLQVTKQYLSDASRCSVYPSHSQPRFFDVRIQASGDCLAMNEAGIGRERQ